MAQRVTLRKRQPYNTTSNRRRVVKTPGGKLVVHHIKKLAVSREISEFARLVGERAGWDGARLGDGIGGREDDACETVDITGQR